jgi:hypothetical protein
MTQGLEFNLTVERYSTQTDSESHVATPSSHTIKSIVDRTCITMDYSMDNVTNSPSNSGWEWPLDLPPGAEFDFTDILGQRTTLRNRQAHTNQIVASQQAQSMSLIGGQF